MRRHHLGRSGASIFGLRVARFDGAVARAEQASRVASPCTADAGSALCTPTQFYAPMPTFATVRDGDQKVCERVPRATRRRRCLRRRSRDAPHYARAIRYADGARPLIRELPALNYSCGGPLQPPRPAPADARARRCAGLCAINVCVGSPPRPGDSPMPSTRVWRCSAAVRVVHAAARVPRRQRTAASRARRSTKVARYVDDLAHAGRALRAVLRRRCVLSVHYTEGVGAGVVVEDVVQFDARAITSKAIRDAAKGAEPSCLLRLPAKETDVLPPAGRRHPRRPDGRRPAACRRRS